MLDLKKGKNQKNSDCGCYKNKYGLVIYQILSSKKDAIQKVFLMNWIVAEIMWLYYKSHCSVKALRSVNSQNFDS